MMKREEVKGVIEKVISFSKLPDCEVSVRWTEDDFIRFANNGITTSAYRVVPQVSITSSTSDHRTGNAVVSELTDQALKDGVAQAEALAAISRIDPEFMPSLQSQNYPVIRNFDDPTASARGDKLIPHVKAVIEGARRNTLISSGFIQRSCNSIGVGNKTGLFGYHSYTDCTLTNTMRNKEGTSSGWSSQGSTSLRDLDGDAAARISIDKCMRGVDRKPLNPGKYTVVLEPAAVGDMIGWLGFSLSARRAEQGQSFLSQKGGGTRLDEKMFPEFITLESDPFSPKLPNIPWSPSLVPNERVAWIENGVVKNMYYDRFWASKAGKKPTPSATNMVLHGQDNSLDDLVKSVERGLLVTRFWYVRMVQPQTWQLTGISRDGLFLIENGKVTDPVTNFRWNESPVEVLQRTTKLGRSERVDSIDTGSTLAPPLVTTDFDFTSVSDAV